VDEEIDQEGFPAERGDCVKCPFHLAERALNRGHFGNMTELTGYAEILRIGVLRSGEYLGEYLEGAALMGHDGGTSGIASYGCHLHREGADVNADI
jgi:hypothetical protein